MNKAPGTNAGIDVGGTFTDLLMLDASGRVSFARPPAEPQISESDDDR